MLLINEIALSVSSEALCSAWALKRVDDKRNFYDFEFYTVAFLFVFFESDLVYTKFFDEELLVTYKLLCYSETWMAFCSIGLVAILFWAVITATLTVSDSVLTDTVFSIS